MHAVIQIGVEEVIKESKKLLQIQPQIELNLGGQGQCISVQFSLVAQNINTKAIYAVHVGTCVGRLIGWLSGASNNDTL